MKPLVTNSNLVSTLMNVNASTQVSLDMTLMALKVSTIWVS